VGVNNISVNKLNTLTGHNDCIYTLERSTSDNLFFSGAGDGMVVQWDLNDSENGQLIAQVPNSIYALKYSPRTGILGVGQNYEGIHLIDVASQKEIGSIKFTEGAIFDIQILDKFLIIGTGNGELIILDPAKFSIVKKLKLSEKSIRSIAVHPLGHQLAAGLSDNSIKIIDLKNLKIEKEINAHQNSVFTLKYFPGTSLLISGSRDAHLKVWDSEKNYESVTSIVAHMYAINHLEFSPDNKHFVTCSMDKSIKVWDANQFKLLKVIDKARHAGHGTSVNKLLWTNFNNQLVSCSDDRSISVWDINFTE